MNAKRDHVGEVQLYNIAAFSYNLKKRGDKLEKKGQLAKFRKLSEQTIRLNRHVPLLSASTKYKISQQCLHSFVNETKEKWEKL